MHDLESLLPQNFYLKTFLYFFLYLPSHSFTVFVCSVASVLATSCYYFYKMKSPAAAKEHRGNFVLAAFVGVLAIMLVYSVQAGTSSHFVKSLYISALFYGTYWTILRLSEKRKKYLIIPCSFFLLTVCLWGANIQYKSYKRWINPLVLCVNEKNAGDLRTVVGNAPPRYSAPAILLGIPIAEGCREE